MLVKNDIFTGRGVELQYWDSQIAVEILTMLADAGVPALPLHDSFIVSEPQEAGLREVMSAAFHNVTGRHPRVDAKDSLTDANRKRGKEAMEAHYLMKNSKEFAEKWSVYNNSNAEWRKVKGKSSIVLFSNTMDIKEYKKAKGEDQEATFFIKGKRLHREIPE